MTDAMLMRFYHGLDVNRLTLAQYFGYLDRISDIVDLETPGGGSHRQRIERMARRRGDG